MDEMRYLASVPDFCHSFRSDERADIMQFYWVKVFGSYKIGSICNCPVWTHYHDGILYHRHGEDEFIYKVETADLHVFWPTDSEGLNLIKWLDSFHSDSVIGV